MMSRLHFWSIRPDFIRAFTQLQETPPYTVTNRLRRLRRLASVLLIQAGETNPSDYVPDIMMNLPGIQPLESEILDSINWKKTILQNSFYNSILETDEAYYMVLGQTTTTDDKPEPKETLRRTLMPRRINFSMENIVSMHHPVYGKENEIGDYGHTKLDNYELMLVKGADGLPSREERNEQIAGVGLELNVNLFDNEEITNTKSKKIKSNVIFSEKNLDEIVLAKGRQSNAQYIAEKIRMRKTTGFNHTRMTPAPVTFLEKNLDDLDLQKKTRRRSNAEIISTKINSRKPTMFSHKFLTPDDNSDDFIKHNSFEDSNPETYVVNDYMNYEEETGTGQFDESGALIKLESSTELDEHRTLSDRSGRFKHRDAIELSILKTREEYHNFHLENPGFFSAVLDTADLQNSGEELEEIAREMLENFKIELKSVGQFMRTHAGLNTEDEETFINERAEFLKWCNHEWDKGYQHPVQHMKDKYGVDKESHTFFERKRSSNNILSPTLPRHHSSAKVRQLIRIGQQQHTKTFEKQHRIKSIQEVEEADIEIDEYEFEDDLETFLAEDENEVEQETIWSRESKELVKEEILNGDLEQHFDNQWEFTGESEEEEDLKTVKSFQSI